MKKLPPIKQLDILAKVRKPHPPTTTVFKNVKQYKRKKKHPTSYDSDC